MPLQLADNKTGTVAMGSQSTQGTNNRDKVLKTLVGDKATAIQTKAIMEMTITESRNLLKDHDVIYFYHNRIDHTGDKMQSEGEAFKATEETFDDLMQVIQIGFETQAAILDKLLGQADQYPFLQALSPIVTELQELKGKPYTWIMAELKSQEDSWFDHKEKVVDPIVKFMKGSQKTTYDDAKKLLNSQKPNLPYLGSSDSGSKVYEQISAALQAPDVYKGHHVQQLKTLTESVSAQLTSLLKQELQIASNSTDALIAKLKSFDQFKALNNGQQEELLKPFDQSRKHLTQQTLVAVIRDESRRFEDETYSNLVLQLMVWSRPATTLKPKYDKPVTTPMGGGGGALQVSEPTAMAQPVVAAPVTVKANQLNVNFMKPWLETEEDVQAYVDEYKKMLLAEIKAGKQVQL